MNRISAWAKPGMAIRDPICRPVDASPTLVWLEVVQSSVTAETLRDHDYYNMHIRVKS